MKEEIKKILKMVEEQKITAEEGEKLLEALQPERSTEMLAEEGRPSPKFLKIRVNEDGQTKVKVNIPIALVDVGLKIASKIGPQYAEELKGLKDVDFEELARAIKEGIRGKLVDIQDGDESVEIYAE
ncbi:MAG: SHOCT-like domain-containing protein [Clostridia bacterium]